MFYFVIKIEKQLEVYYHKKHKMNLLVITQKYDGNDSNLGAFNIWWDKIAQKTDKIYILALEKHSEAYAPNMTILSMGKEKGLRKIGRLFNFYKNLFKILSETDIVFVHMIPLYLILAWLPAKIFGNKIIMWYAGVTMNNWVRLAVWLSDKSLTSQEGALRTKSRKRLVIGHGIDTDKFQISGDKLKADNQIIILSVGRITPSKGHDLIIKSVADLIGKGYELKLNIIGGVIQEYHREYFEYLKKLATDLNISKKVEFTGDVNYNQMPGYYDNAEILIDAVPAGGFDKVILEAMASGVVPLTSNEYLKPVFPENLREKLFFKQGDLKDLLEKLKAILDKKFWEDGETVIKLRNIVVEKYSLGAFIDKLFHIFNELVFNELAK